MSQLVPSRVGATAKQIARAVRRGDDSATRVVADHLDHIAVADRVVSAFRTVRAAAAAAEAEKVDQQPDLGNLPLAGVPVAVKENTAVAGLANVNGSRAATTAVAEADHEVVRRLRGAGAVIVGTTRMPELGLWAVTDADDAAARNPWRTDRTPGGSSGGAAAAVASGMVPLAHGNDGLGSIRIPAACCGVVGVKPGSGVVPGEDPGLWFGLVEHGVLATTVADAALGLDVLSGAAPRPLQPPDRLRIAVSLRSPVPGVWPDGPTRAALADAARALVGAGHDAAVADPPYAAALRAGSLWFAAANRSAAALGVPRSRLQARSRHHAAAGAVLERLGLVREADQQHWRRRSLDFFGDRFDALLTPVLSRGPVAAAGWAGRSWLANLRASSRFAPYAAPWNVAGLPAVSVPVGVRPDGLPGAVQLVGPPGSERTLLALAGQLELVRPWARHAPTFPRPAAVRAA
ncbi:putative amidase AmiB2 [Pilimelia anulata]|uniref:Putative amidase AmiB2 n=1 Tax=Pilimelia anulata TaxID=53371 RepID=A0A8J3BG34_9ACTN|nr:amidase family protein [Pilimelia anulata]GGK05056.1 putative amidase AmiB2 [Pilimelia anulata]